MQDLIDGKWGFADAADFKEAAMAYFDFTDHDNADKIWALAWEEGHASGYLEVFDWLAKLREIT